MTKLSTAYENLRRELFSFLSFLNEWKEDVTISEEFTKFDLLFFRQINEIKRLIEKVNQIIEKEKLTEKDLNISKGYLVGPKSFFNKLYPSDMYQSKNILSILIQISKTDFEKTNENKEMLIGIFRDIFNITRAHNKVSTNEFKIDETLFTKKLSSYKITESFNDFIDRLVGMFDNGENK